MYKLIITAEQLNLKAETYNWITVHDLGIKNNNIYGEQVQ